MVKSLKNACFRRLPRRSVLTILLVGAGCSAQTDSPTPSPAITPDTGLATSLEVEVTPVLVKLALHVTNRTNAPVQMEFPTAQRYDFAIRTASGEEVWRWSADQMFAQVVGTETIPAGGTVTYRAEWRPEGRRGTYEAIGRVTSTTPVEQRTTFELTDDGKRPSAS